MRPSALASTTRRCSEPGRRRHRRAGFTLVELMVGLAVGLFVSVIAISLFVSTRKLQSVNSSSNRMAENARLAFDFLHRDLRLAGFRGCADDYERAPTTVLDAGNGGFLVDASGVAGYHGTASGFAPLLPAVFNGLPKAPVADSDIVSVRVPVDAESLGLAVSMASNADAPNVGTVTLGRNTIDSGDVVLLANCKNAVLFQVTGPAGGPAATGLLPHDVGGGALPGNVNADLGARYNRSDSALYRMQTRHYYVAESARRPGTRSLWRLTVPTPPGAAQAFEEVVPGVDALRLSFGLDASATPDRAADRYVRADQVGVGNWSKVLSARVDMLAATTANGTAGAASSVRFAGSTVSIDDRRLREVFSEVIAFRNQMP